ncbi:MAG: hypothetical protein RRZ83_01830 [Alistipes sp.]
MKYTIFKISVALFVAVMMVSCSLLKFSVSTGDPLPRSDVQARVMTRGFYYDLTAEIARTADSIVAATPDVQTKVRAIRWKMQSTQAAVSAAMQSVPDVALADTWILCRRMKTSFAATPDEQLFGVQSRWARATVGRLEKRANALAHDVLTSDRYALMERFVEEYIAANPVQTEGVEPVNTTLAWLNYLKANGIDHAYATGTISEVVADMSDRVGGQTQQFSNSIGWSKDIFELQMQQDSTRTKLERQLDSLNRDFTRMAVVMEHMPEISEQAIRAFSDRVQGLIYTMNASVDNAFTNIDTQRAELQLFIAAERKEMMVDASKAADSAVRTALDGLPGLLGKMVVWLILLAVVLLGMPFAAGFWLGTLRERLRERKKK